jgi:hypothetical protein
MVEENVWVGEKIVRPRLSRDEVWLMYRLVDNQYWLLRRHPNPFFGICALYEQNHQKQLIIKLTSSLLGSVFSIMFLRESVNQLT